MVAIFSPRGKALTAFLSSVAFLPFRLASKMIFTSTPRSMAAFNSFATGIAELVEASPQGVALLGLADEAKDRLVQPVAEPVQRVIPFLPFHLARLAIVELADIGLAAGDAAVEEHVVFALGVVCGLGPHGDFQRREPIEALRIALHGVEEIVVLVARLGGEVVPDEGLYGVIVRAHREVRPGIGYDLAEDLEAVHVVLLVLLFVAALDGEAQQPLGVGFAGVDAEGNRVHAAHGVDGVTVLGLRFESHVSGSVVETLGWMAAAAADRRLAADLRSGSHGGVSPTKTRRRRIGRRRTPSPT